MTHQGLISGLPQAWLRVSRPVTPLCLSLGGGAFSSGRKPAL
jgi:hypothetical protein